MAEPIVQVRNLGKVYEPSPGWMKLLLRSAISSPVVALDDVSFEVGKGEIVAVVGPNGAGKSTLFRILTGLTTPTTGWAKVMGLDSTRESYGVRRVVGFVPADDRSLFLRHTARDNLLFHAQLQGLPSKKLRQMVNDTLELVGLSEASSRVGFALSAGMRARLQLARALVHEPQVLILDEPTGSVDPVGSAKLLKTLEEVTAERGLAVVISSHRLEEIEALHDSVVLLDRGVLVYRGDLDSLRARWERPRIQIRFSGDDAARKAAEHLSHISGVEIVDVVPPELTIRSDLGVGAVLGALDGQLPDIQGVQEKRISLRDLLAEMSETPARRLDHSNRAP